MLKNLDNYTQSDPIGNGGYGKVYIAEENQTGKRFAFKFLHLLNQYRSDDAFQKEVSRLSSVRHLCLKHIVGYFTENQNEMQPEQLPGIITTYEPAGSLDKEIKEESSASWLNIANQVVFLFAVASALNKLHEQKIYHGDLKPANIFLAKDTENQNHGFCLPLIGDYGLASISESDESVSQSAFRAPELINGFIPPKNQEGENEASSAEVLEPNEKTDAFSFGMLVFYIFVNKFPRGKNAKPLLQGLRPDIPKTIPHGIRKVLSQCWDHDPSQRPSMKTVMKMIIESRIDLEYPSVGEFMYEIEPQIYSLTQIALLHHDNLKSRVLMSEKEKSLTEHIENLQKENQELKDQLKRLKDFEESSKSQMNEVKAQIENQNGSEIYQEIENAKTEAVNEAVNLSFEKFTEQFRDKDLRRSLLYPQLAKKTTTKRIKKRVLKNNFGGQNQNGQAPKIRNRGFIPNGEEESFEGFAELTQDDEEEKFEYEYEYEEEDDYDDDLISNANKKLLRQLSQDLESIKIKQDEADKAVRQIGSTYNANNESQISNLNKAVDLLSEKVETANGVVSELKTSFIPSFNSLQTDYGKIKAEIDNKFAQLEKSLNEITNSYQEVNNHINQLHDNVESFASTQKEKSVHSRNSGSPYLGDITNFESLSELDQNVVRIIEDFNQRLNKIEMMMNLQNEEVSSCLGRLNLLSGANLSNVQKKLSEIENLVGKITIHKDELEANLIRYAIPITNDKIVHQSAQKNSNSPPKNASSYSPPKINSPKDDFSPNSSQKQINLNTIEEEDENEAVQNEDEKVEYGENGGNNNNNELLDNNNASNYQNIDNVDSNGQSYTQQSPQFDQQLNEEEARGEVQFKEEEAQDEVQQQHKRQQDDEEFTLKPFEEFENDNE